MKKVTRYILGTLLVVFGSYTLIEFLVLGYDPDNDDIKLFSIAFQRLFNAIMESWYIPVSVRIIQVIGGGLLFTRKYWFIGALLNLPIAFNILMMHLFFDIPPAAYGAFFIPGMLVCIPNFYLVFSELAFLNRLIKE